MIDAIQGELVSKSPASVVIGVGGVAFRVLVPLSTYEKLPPQGAEARLLTHLHVREDVLALYGFATEAERELFRMLLGVSQVGPAVALRVLSGCSVARFKQLILDEDADALKGLVKGVGPKTARRLIVELRGPIEGLSVAAEPGGRAATNAIRALVALGESQGDARRAVMDALKALGPDADEQRLVQEALARR